jgi:ubiquinone/menaquinone biosynthesis C-methylase UbiE
VTTDEDLKTAVSRAWDAGAPTYDATPRHGLRHDDEWVAWRRLVAAILGDPSHADVPTLRVLDVGTGTGVLALLAAELGHDVTGIDLSTGMLEVARRRAAEAGLAVELRVADAEALPAGLVGFDAVMSRHVLWTLPHPDGALAAWRDATRPGGLVAVIDGIERPGPLPLAAARRLAGAIVERRRRPDPGHDYDEATAGRLPLAGLRETATVEALMRGAGLEHVRVRDVGEVDRVELAHLSPLERFADAWRRYLATGRSPRVVAG